VLLSPDGSLTERAKTILARTPMGRVPVDGGFSADSGI
jgi:hypothetical protein